MKHRLCMMKHLQFCVVNPGYTDQVECESGELKQRHVR